MHKLFTLIESVVLTPLKTPNDNECCSSIRSFVIRNGQSSAAALLTPVVQKFLEHKKQEE